ncbi:MAG: glycosyltransferase family 4 protein [Acidimicrobiales bacterium]
MKVTLVAQQFRRPVPGGIGTYTRGLLMGLAAMGDDAPNVCLTASRAPAGPDPLEDFGVAYHPSAAPARVLTGLWAHGLMSMAADAGVVHSTSLAFPNARGPLSVTIHDLSWRNPANGFSARGVRWHEAALDRAFKRARLLIVPSPQVADSVRTAGASPDLVHVVPEGCDHLGLPDAGATDELLKRHGIDTPFLLSVSTLEPRKNLSRLFQAYALARGRLPGPWPLVVVGPKGWGDAPERTPGVVLVGSVADGVLSGLYGRAQCVAYVPLEEGFGLPAVEAMAAGAGVVASPVPSLGLADEATGLGSSPKRPAWVVDPLNLADMAEGLVAMCTDGPDRDEVIRAGTDRAALLTWQACARRHVALWESIA